MGRVLRADFWRLSELVVKATVAVVVDLVRLGLAALAAVTLVAVVGEGIARALGGRFTDLPNRWLVPLLVATATLVCLLFVVAFYNRWHDEPRDDVVNLRVELESFVFESTTYDSETAERWSADVPGPAEITGLIVVAVSLVVLAVLLPVAVGSGYVGHALVLLAVLVVVAVVRSDVEPVRPLSEQVGFSLGGALLGAAFLPGYLATAVALGGDPHPVASLVAFPVVGTVAFYCLLLADDAARVRRGAHPPEADADLADADLPASEPVRPFRALGRRLPDVSLRVRLAATLAAVLLLNLAVVAVGTWAVYALVSAVGGTVPASLPVLGGALLLAALLLVVAEARYGYRRALDGVDAREVPPDHEVAVRVRRLAQIADVPAPSVAVMESGEANSFSVGNGSDVTVVVTTGLLDALDGDELDAVLAHEVAHVANRDTTVATVAATLTAVSGSLRRRERRLANWLRLLVLAPAVPAMLLFALPVLLLVPVYVTVSVVARAFLACNAVCTGIHARTREYAADRAAAGIVGDPGSVAAALESLSNGGRPETDARLDATASLGIVPLSLRADDRDDDDEPTRLKRWFPWLLGDTDTPTSRFLDRLGRALEWRPTTHPPTDERVRRLRRLDRP